MNTSEQVERTRNFFSGAMMLPAFSEEAVEGGSLLGYLVDRKGPREPVEYAFLVHPRDAFDALACTKVGPVNLSSLYHLSPRPVEQWLKNHFLYNQLAKIPPFFIRDGLITVANSEVKGNLLAVLLYGEQMLSPGWGDLAQKRIVEAINMARDKGIKVVGLGAHTSPATAGGERLVGKLGSTSVIHKKIKEGIGITNGNALTAAMSAETIRESVRILGLEPREARVGILGARGSVGSAVSLLLNEEDYNLQLMGRSKRRLSAKFGKILDTSRVSYSEKLEDLHNCDVVLVVTSSAEETVRPEHIQSGTIVIDDTQPRNISLKMAKAIQDRGSVVIDGGYVYLPGFHCGFNLRLKGYSLACLTETFLVAREPTLLKDNGGHYSIGDAKPEQAKEIMEVAKGYGIKLAPATCYGQLIPGQVLTEVGMKNKARLRSPAFYPVAS